MSTKHRPIPMTDQQWSAIQSLAEDAGMSASEWVRQACARAAADAGVDFEASPPHGGPRSVEYRRHRGDIRPYAWEWARAEGDEVVASGSDGFGLVWQGDDPYKDVWRGKAVADLLADGFEPPVKWRTWVTCWGREFGEI